METFSALLALCAGNSPVTCEFPTQRPVARSFDVSLIYVWINDWVNNREAGDLRRYRGHYDVTVMSSTWDVITNPHPNFITVVEVWAWMSNYIPLFYMDIIT